MRARGCKDANRDKAAKDAHAKVDAKEALRGYTVRDHLDARRTKLCNLGQFLAVEIHGHTQSTEWIPHDSKRKEVIFLSRWNCCNRFLHILKFNELSLIIAIQWALIDDDTHNVSKPVQ